MPEAEVVGGGTSEERRAEERPQEKWGEREVKFSAWMLENLERRVRLERLGIR